MPCQQRLAALVILASLTSTPALPQEPALTYAVKFVCGVRDSVPAWDAVYPGRYFTAINIRNPSPGSVSIATQIATVLPTPSQGSVSSGPVLKLERGHAVEVDCQELLRVAGKLRFLKGFLVILAPVPLNVVAVYTTGTASGPASIDVETIMPTLNTGKLP